MIAGRDEKAAGGKRSKLPGEQLAGVRVTQSLSNRSPEMRKISAPFDRANRTADVNALRSSMRRRSASPGVKSENGASRCRSAQWKTFNAIGISFLSELGKRAAAPAPSRLPPFGQTRGRAAEIPLRIHIVFIQSRAERLPLPLGHADKCGHRAAVPAHDAVGKIITAAADRANAAVGNPFISHAEAAQVRTDDRPADQGSTSLLRRRV